MMANPDILLVHPQFDKIGGAERVAIKIIKILTDSLDYNVHILSYSNIDTDSIFKQSGYLLNKDKITFNKLRLPSFIKSRLFRLRIALLHRKAIELQSKFSFTISTYNEQDFGCYSFQYIHHPMLVDEDILISNNLAYKKTFKSKLATYLYKVICDFIAKRQFENIKNNYTVTNSNFISTIVKNIYEIQNDVVYPSLPIFYSNNVTIRKEKQILTINRFSKLKNVHSLLTIFDELHEYLPDFKFVIAGFVEDEVYFQSLLTECNKKKYQVDLKPNLSSQDIELLYKQSLYYINPKEYEHFGIAVLESMCNNCIPLVHKSGGSLELVPFSQLQFQNEKEVSQKILAIENNSSLKSELLVGLNSNLSKFSEELFELQIKNHFTSFFDLTRSKK